ncbi:hypothetical protein Tsubulata_010394 [Turnera subulata]|uniref:DUF4283 domain-containing protein n=1 Tax=Turnera subulata TaxID=218843 RepID=A0A9Q0G252_9ROSI|nr:hypothetical protein Tsubulata_010394 [Turnera subulata]
MPIRDLSDFISSHSSMNCQVVPLGGTSFLVKYDSIEERDMLVHEKPEWVDLLFSIFRPWKFGDVSCDRLCWVLIKGTPPHTWSKDFFQLISTRVGSLVDWSLESKSGERLDVAEVLILTTSIKFINCSFQVTIEDDQFGISIVETQYDPLEWSIPSSELSVLSDAPMTPSVPRVFAHAGFLPTLEVGDCSTDSKDVVGHYSSSSKTTATLSDACTHSVPSDPFNLRPLIEKLPPGMGNHMQPQSSQSPKYIPSELSSFKTHNDVASPNVLVNPHESSTQPLEVSVDLAHQPITVSRSPEPLVPYPSSPLTHDSGFSSPSPQRPAIFESESSTSASPCLKTLSVYNVPSSSPPSENSHPNSQKTVDRKVAAIPKHMELKRKTKYVSSKGSIMMSNSKTVFKSSLDMGSL